jgi:UDP-glucose 4-epimerase
MTDVLVTGGAGFIGSHVAEGLVKRGHCVTVLDDLSGGFIDNIVAGARFVQGTVNNVDLVQALFDENQFEYVFHLAAYAAEGLSHFIKRFYYTNNLIGSANLINASINTGVKCFVFTSLIPVYGASSELPMTEETLPHPEDPYGIANLAVEHELRVCRDTFDLDFIIFRPHIVYGERQNVGDKYRNEVGIFVSQILQDKPMTIFEDGSQTRAFSYIGDMAMAPIIAESIEVPGAYNQVFNIGAAQPCTVNELALSVPRAVGVESSIVHLPACNEVTHAYSSHDWVRCVFGERKLNSLEEGLCHMAKRVKAHGSGTSQKFKDIEVTKNWNMHQYRKLA